MTENFGLFLNSKTSSSDTETHVVCLLLVKQTTSPDSDLSYTFTTSLATGFSGERETDMTGVHFISEMEI